MVRITNRERRLSMYRWSTARAPKSFSAPSPPTSWPLTLVPPAKAKAQEVDPKSVFYAFGTVGIDAGFSKPGILNMHFPKLYF